jgi:ADP-ribose pyrophosphatase YjhB (NUDIX family)
LLKLLNLKKKRYSGVIVKCNDKVLLCKRNNDGSLPGEWSIPGGKIEIDETPIDGAVREFYEETNLEIVAPITLCGMLKRYTRDGKNVKGLMYTFLMETDSEMIPDLEKAFDGSEHTECGYFTYDELPEPIGEELKKLIKTILYKKVDNIE